MFLSVINFGTCQDGKNFLNRVQLGSLNVSKCQQQQLTGIEGGVPPLNLAPASNPLCTTVVC